MKKSINLLAGVAALLLLASTSYAASFDLNLSALDSTLVDVADIVALDAYTSNVALTMDSNGAGTFSEVGDIRISSYDTGTTTTYLSDLGLSPLVFHFELEGTYQTVGTETSFAFLDSQSISLIYDTATIATFDLENDSNGEASSIALILQTYYLTLSDNPGGLFDNADVNFMATLLAYNFANTGYQLMGELVAAPVPVPGSFILIGSGLLFLFGSRRRA